MRTQCVKGQQHANNLRRNNDVNVGEINEQSVPEIDRCVWWKPTGVSLFYGCLS